MTCEFKTSTRRFPPPWSVGETIDCFIIRDAHCQEPSLRLL